MGHLVRVLDVRQGRLIGHVDGLADRACDEWLRRRENADVSLVVD